MNLKYYNFRPDYNKSDNNIATEFYIPAMKNSCKYDRIAGYFGSTIYIIAWSALREFVANKGKIRIICSPFISDSDKYAMKEGYSAKNNKILEISLKREMNNLLTSNELEDPAKVLSCLIANGTLNVKIAIPKSNAEPDLKRLFHDKVGIFTDSDGNSVGFRGSMNETFQGLSEDGNLESIDVFPSWDGYRDALRLKSSISYFNRIWNGKERRILVYEFPEAIRNEIIRKSKGYDWKMLTKRIISKISLIKKWRADKKNFKMTPRKHQIEVLENWVKNDCRGIVEHATGSGKTYTAICAIRKALDEKKSVLVIVPSKELLYQWKEEISKNITDLKIHFLLCGDGNNSWEKNNTLQLWTRPDNTFHKVTIVIMDTACSPKFVDSVISGKHLMIVVDEVHRIGSPARRNIFNIKANVRLGLSATPKRYGDEEGTRLILNYFSGILKPIFTLNDAIKAGVLTKYYYFPNPIYLTSKERKNWLEVTKKINRLIAINTSRKTSLKTILKKNPKVKLELIKRARIVKQASNKVNLALNIIKAHYKKGQKWIIYCDDKNQLNKILNLLLKEKYDAYRYVAEMSGDRNETLKYFSINGGILVSIRCLDEGINIPSVTDALILASSKNPREFIQRRGRILREYPGKPYARLYDAVVIPDKHLRKNNKFDSIIETELSRAIKFGSGAENPSCIYDLKIIARRLGINYEKVKDEGYEDEN